MSYSWLCESFHTKHRKCNNPSPVNTEEGCEGPSFDVELCKDDKVCKKTKRIKPADYARKKCEEFSKTLSILDPLGSGLQAPHEEGRLWVACAIFCRRKDNGSYYSPRLDLNDLGSDPYFPDGTWCHHNGKHNYYCMNHHCRPEHFQGAKSALDLPEDLELPQNALPKALPLPDLILRYLSLGSDGKPLLTTIKPEEASERVLEDGWASKDYLDIPQPM
ncbi:uncharacterized protein LOC128997502 [Macrosteles quadrilineatus]|uniref:uncharacterized protein LOC128997502 n=1 Tax=Macrosteles quadrilineatus TaxID=74068 RepID=UPI0023E2FFB0|nr:uncharacterized protein LOC128997502 [Macrosteles quadrilineatus]